MTHDTPSTPPNPSRYAKYTALAVAFVAVQAVILFFLGQPLIAADGQVKLWEGVVLSPGNSQHLSDWYTFSHILHGFLFYGLVWLAFRRQGVGVRFLMCVVLEAGWEIVENTPMVIEHYRKQALAQGYTGDSILNSVSDTLAMMLGFLAAWRLPVWAVVVLGLAMEVFVAYWIRDNLTLNVLNLIHGFEAIERWQGEG